MKKIITLVLFLTLFVAIKAQTVANVEGVFGGSINAITAAPLNNTGNDTFKIIVSTQSANSIFYANAIIPITGGTVRVDSFVVLPSANASAGLGSGINKIAYHQTSQKIFFISNGNIYSSSLTATSATAITTTNGYADFFIKADKMYALSTNGGNTFSIGNIDASGAVSFTSSATIFGTPYTALVAAKNDKLFAFREGTDPEVIQFGGTFSTSINLSSTTLDVLSTLPSTYQWKCMNVATDGTVFIGGNDNTSKQIAKATSFGGTYNIIATGIAGIAGNNIDFGAVNTGIYDVYFGSAYSTNKGNTGSWQNFGNISYETHPNDGAVFFARKNSVTGNVVFITTDQGIGYSKNGGSVISEIDNGINAVQVNDFDMNAAKTVGWLASKTGIRYVENYNNASKNWSKAIYPNSDGSPYYSCEMVDADTVFVGNSRVYKTNNRGNSWTQVFTAENSPYNFANQYAPRVSSIAVGGSNNEIIMAGYKLYNGARGGVFYSINNGNTWQQLLINASAFGQDVNVNDIEMTIDSGRVVAYIGVDYDNSTSPIIKGMYKAQWNGTSWAVRAETIYSAASSLISINDIHIVSKDTIVAVGAFYNATLHHDYPIHFEISRTIKNTWSSTVVDTSRTNGYNAVSWSGDTLFYAYSNVIYWDIIKFYSTYTYRKGEAEYYSVPIGTEINVLFYDDLLAGTETDIRSIRGATTIRRPVATTSTHRSACSGETITGGSPAGGYYYIVDTLADAYVKEGNGEYTLLFATNGVLTGESSTSFENIIDLTNAFSTLSLTYFTTVTTYPTSSGTYIIGYTDANFSAASVTDTTTVNTSTAIANITGTNYSCAIMGTTSNLSNATLGGVWSSSNINVASINNSGVVTIGVMGTTVINYSVTNTNGCVSVATTNFIVSNLPMLQPITGGNGVCVGATNQLSNATSLPTNTTASWSSIAGRATVSSTGLVTGTSAGNATIKYTITNTYGCSSYNTKMVSVNATPTMPVIVYAPNTPNPKVNANYCTNKTFTLVGNPTGGVWSSTGVVTIINPNGTINTGNVAGIGSVTYTYTNNKGCNNSRTIIGTIVTCASRGIVNEKQETSGYFVMYPNPAKTFISLKINLLFGAATIVITDLYGKEVKRQVVNGKLQVVNVEDLSKGIYFVSVVTIEGKITEKLVVN